MNFRSIRNMMLVFVCASVFVFPSVKADATEISQVVNAGIATAVEHVEDEVALASAVAPAVVDGYTVLGVVDAESGYINIRSGNDGINTNEDGVSVTAINGGTLNIVVTGTTGEGDGIDSNGWLVINGGTVTTQACDFSMDAGIDSDMGIHINGGTVCVTGNMLDRISDSKQNFVVFEFNKAMSGALSLKDSADTTVAECATENSFKYLLFSNENIVPGEYTLWEGFGIQHVGYATGNMGGFGGRPGGAMPDGVKLPENVQPGETPPNFPEGNFADMTPPPSGNFEIPYPPANADEPQNNGERKEQFDGQKPDDMFSGENKKNKGEKPIDMEDAEVSNIFTIQEGANYFYIVIS